MDMGPASDAELTQQVADLADRGASIRRIMRELGMGRHQVRRRLLDAGRAPSPPRRWDVTPADVARRYTSGDSIAQIAADLGCSPHIIGNRLREAGIHPRRPGRPRGS